VKALSKRILPWLYAFTSHFPSFYCFPHPSLERSGWEIQAAMSGQAKLFDRRRSFADRIVTVFGNVLHTHFW
jgi:hypothetical protein